MTRTRSKTKNSPIRLNKICTKVVKTISYIQGRNKGQYTLIRSSLKILAEKQSSRSKPPAIFENSACFFECRRMKNLPFILLGNGSAIEKKTKQLLLNRLKQIS